MKKNSALAKCLPTKATWRRAGAATLVISMLAGMAPARAQDPSRNEAVLNFVGADIESVVKAVGHYTGTNFLIDPRVKGTISLISEKPVTKAQAMQLLSSALRLQGYTVVASGPFTKVVPEADAKLQAGPIQTTPGRGGDGGAVRGDQIATQVFKLNYESAVNMVPVLRPLISPNNTINANPGTNSLVITDYADNLRRLGRIIASLDMPAAADLDVLPIRHAVATDIATMVNRLLDGGSAGGQPGAQGAVGGSDRTSLLADSRTNSVIIRAPSEARARLARSLVDKLDQPTAMPGNVHVIYLKNAEATKLALTLRAVVASDPSASGLQTGTTGATSTPTNPALTNTSGPGLGQTGGGLGQGQGGLGQGGMGMGLGQSGQGQGSGPLPTGGPGGFIQADAATNSLIITASEAVYRNLRSVVDQLDARRAQVYIESLIVEVSAKRAAEFGIQWAGLSGDGDSSYRIGTITGFSSGGNNLITQAAARLAGTTTGATPALQAPGNGLNLGLFRQVAGQLTLGLIARALESEGNANILSMPNLITLDNEEARIIVGQNVPFVTGQYTTAASGGAAGVNPFQTVERKDIGLSLVVKPQVSEGGTVKMAIYQETSAIDNSATTATTGLITTKRAIQTNVLVDNGEIVVLGGLIDDRNSNGTEKVPGLGDIPVVGNLFKYQNTSREKTNLMVFLRPTLIRNTEQNLNVANDRYEYIRGQQLQTKQITSPVLPDVGKPIVPVMENGRLKDGDLLNLPPGANGIPPRNPLQPGMPPETQPVPVQPALPPQPAVQPTTPPQFTQ